MFLLLIATLTICHIVTGYGERYHDNFGPPSSFESESPTSEDDDLIHPPWWHPKKPDLDSGPQKEFGRGHHGFGPGHHGRHDFGPGHHDRHDFGPGHHGRDDFGPGLHDFGRYRPNGGWGGDRPGNPWNPWGQRPTSGRPEILSTSSTQVSGWSSTTSLPQSSSPLPGLSSTTSRQGIDLVVESCKAVCPVTPEHNPVCGTDDITYGNIGKLECARKCGVDVQIRRTGNCPTPLVIPTPPPEGESGGIDNSRVQTCMRNCPVTSEYNPVCGTDNVTYANPGRLECAISCGAAVQLNRNTACSVPPSASPGDVIAECLRSCTVTSEYNPVCGSDGVTYPNLGRLECARNCGVDVQLSRQTSCTVPENLTPIPITSSTSGVSRGDWETTETQNGNGNWGGNGNLNDDGNGNGTPTVTDLITCMQLCPITPEVNPVCGTDGVTYSNPGKLLCSQFCGVDVRVLKFAPCNGDPIPSPYPMLCPTPPTVPLNHVQDCIAKCPTSPEFQPVCGTDNVTYINMRSLQCRINCGVDVSIQRHTACDTPTENITPHNPPVWENTDRPTQPTAPVVTESTIPGNVIQNCINDCDTTQELKPVCGTNGKTYTNRAALLCEQKCGINVDVKYVSACENSPMIEATTSVNLLDFTIPPEVLASIFPEIPISSTSVAPAKDSDEEYDLDQRYGEGDASTNKTTTF